MRSLRTPWPWALFGLALALDLAFLSRKPFEYDELLTWHLARADWGTLLRCDIEPPGFYLWARPLRGLFRSPISLRAFEATAAALWTLPAWAVAESVGGRGIAFGATLALTFHPLRLRCGQYGRADALAALLDLMALWALVSLLGQADRKGRGAKSALFFLLSTLTWFVYLPFSTSLISRALLLIGLVMIRRAPLGAAVAALLSVALFICWSATHVAPHAPSLGRAFWGGLLMGAVEPPTGHMTAFFRTGLEGLSAAVSFPLDLLALLGTAGLSRGAPGAAVAASWLGPVLVSAAICGLGRMPPQPGYLTASLAPFLICLVAGLTGLRRRWTKALFVALATILPLGSGLYLLRPTGTADFRGPARFILSRARAGDVVFCQPPGADIPMRHYLRGKVHVEPSAPTIWTRAGYFVGLPARRLGRADWETAKRRAVKADRIWLVEWLYSPSARLRWPRWPEGRGYKAALRRAFLGHTQAVVVTLYLRGQEKAGRRDDGR